MKYRREIDGLRTVAVLPVILFHAGFSTFRGGYVGVDIFFVISGYLITSIILAEKEAGKFTLLSFYERRARRILPALFFVMVACLPFAWMWMSPFELKNFSRSLVAVSVFASNLLFWRESGYFGPAVELKPLLHTWSLAVEEQYYVLFPLFVMAAWRLGKQRMLMLLGLVSISSFALMQWLVFKSQDSAFFLLPTRAWELLLGAFAAFHLGGRALDAGASRLLQQGFSVLGLALILASIFLYDHNTPFPSAYALAPTVGALLIILFASPATFVGTLLGSRPFVGIGLISYSAYLWHQPLFAFARLRVIDPPSPALMLVLAVASLALAWVSWKFVEAPFRTRATFQRKQVFALAGLASALMIGLGVLGNASQGFNEAYRARLTPEDRVLWDQIVHANTHPMDLAMPDDGDCNFWGVELDARFSQRFEQCSKKYGQAVVALGDSHAMNLYSLLHRSGFSKFLVGIAQGGCRPPMGAPNCPYGAFTEFLSTHRQSISLIVYNQSGQYLIGEDDSGRYGDYRDWKPPVPSLPTNPKNVAKTLEYLQGLQHGNIVWLGPWVEPAMSLRNLKALRGDRTHVVDVVSRNFIDLDRTLATDVRERLPTIRYISSIDLLAYDPKQYVLIGNCITFRDEDHFSECGEEILGARIVAGLESHRSPQAVPAAIQAPRIQ